ncbi:MAG: cobaltochelatase subunit CobN, partial [Pseudomonadota bacterium]
AANNPSEGAVARRRSGATLVSYLTPPVSQSGLYKGLLDLKETIDHWRSLPPGEALSRTGLIEAVGEQARALDFEVDDAALANDPDTEIVQIANRLSELEHTLIPEGLHIIGAKPSRDERAGFLHALAAAQLETEPVATWIDAILDGRSDDRSARAAGAPQDEQAAALTKALADIDRRLMEDSELNGLFTALDGGYVRPAPGGDLLRNPDILPTGRNLHGFDPFRLPSAFAVRDGAAQAERLLARHLEDSGRIPESVAFVLWGADNLKTGGGPIAQTLALMGARPRLDGYGRVCGAELIPLEELGRPRIDVVMTLSGIFRDLLPLQIKMLAEAAFLAAASDEPDDQNFIAKHARAKVAETGCDLETAALRVFSNADGAYGANVNQMIDGGRWSDADELADVFETRKCFAFGRNGRSERAPDHLAGALSHVELTYQNLESLELGVTTVDHYVDMLGGVSRAVRRARGAEANVYVGDQTQGEGKVRSLAEQIRLETFTRTLNPRWYEGALRHGYEGVRNIENQVTNTMGWSATTGQVDPWVYEKISETFVLDEEMRRRLAELNPKASVRMANRLMEAHEREYWSPDEETLEALRRAGDELEDRLEGVTAAAE